MFKVNNKVTRKKDVIEAVLVSSLLTLNYFTLFPSFVFVEFKQVI